MYRTQDEWIKLFQKLGAFWKHDGNPARPHALLTKGGHSDGFFNWAIVAQNPIFARQVAENLFAKLMTMGEFTGGEFQRVIGPGSGAITLADRLAEAFPNALSGYTEKYEGGKQALRRFDCTGQLVVPCEDTITSGGSVLDTIKAIETAGGKVTDFILAVCNRSGMKEIDGREIIALIDVPMSNWTSEECPLCKQGSEAISPKRDNWARLTATR